MTASVYRRTPSLTVRDSRGLPIRQIAYLRTIASETAAAQVTRQQYDAAGRLVAQWGPRLSRPNLATVHGLGRAPLKVDSVDAGWRLSLPGLAGQALQRWDARGSHWRTTYDDQLRVVTVEENAQPDVETFTYANTAADAGHNLRGRLLEQRDPSGTLRFDSYGLPGQPLRETRTFHDAKAFASRRTYSPLGAVLEQIDAGDHRQQLCYDLAGQLKQVQLKINGQPGWQSVLQEAQYNAAGQVIEQQAGNGVISRWSYDPADARLQRQCAQKDQQPALQDFEYVYDRAGHITRILDHVFTPRHFANQRVDGHREFRYDSLYRLHSASGYDDGPPSDIPGLPQPTDPQDRRNYTQTYEYDPGGNLIKLIHVREGASHTRQMFIDPASNRGVRWTSSDPDPQFDKLFDRHGNLQALQPGQDLRWNARDQLESVILVHRDDGPDDEEHYRYSQGARVYKRHETHTATTRHFHEVRYLPGLEIRTRDNGEVLHVIILGGIRCLHWLVGKPAGIEADQLRYSLDDHLGSCLMELDQQASLISHEGYYPFGATAWMAAHSVLEVRYKTVRYSGKEMDASGLYYYGARYYAPWLQRWISADPAGDVDGLNLYGFVGNNPLNYFDEQGESKTPSELKREIVSGFKFLSSVHHAMNTLNKQLDDLSHPTLFRLNILKNFVYQAGSIPVGWYTSFHAAGTAAGLFPDFSDANPHLSGALSGMLLGNRVADESTGLYATLMAPLKLNTPVVPDPSAFSTDTLKERTGLATSTPSNRFFRAPTGDELIENSITLVSKTVGAYIPGVGEAFAMAKVAEDGSRAEEGLYAQEINEIESTLDQLSETTLSVAAMINANFAALEINAFYEERHYGLDYLIDLGLGRVGAENSRMVKQGKLQHFKERALEDIGSTKLTLNRYRHHVTQKATQKAA
ncbi:RHS repeat domain-containing protein [Pseudomonas sp. A-RE-19]|uniref:RHS repeat domain-containing protein n=1 Tax=Pseudomonas sp. A-RE-19 TaxID=2832401 RepID=UPI001CC1B5CF|nr:RHS repeat-associated core domain-containing protein [Pseudomonas sp. A-RE-19]